MLRLRCGTVRDSTNIHAAIREIPTKNIDLFLINLSSSTSLSWLVKVPINFAYAVSFDLQEMLLWNKVHIMVLEI